jgi:hypothetical protein
MTIADTIKAPRQFVSENNVVGAVNQKNEFMRERE